MHVAYYDITKIICIVFVSIRLQSCPMPMLSYDLYERVPDDLTWICKTYGRYKQVTVVLPGKLWHHTRDTFYVFIVKICRYHCQNVDDKPFSDRKFENRYAGRYFSSVNVIWCLFLNGSIRWIDGTLIITQTPPRVADFKFSFIRTIMFEWLVTRPCRKFKKNLFSKEKVIFKKK